MNRTKLTHEVAPTPVEVECVLPAKAIIGEGPLWSVKEQRLYWADIPEKKVHIFNPADGSNQTFELPEMVTSISTRENGGLLLTLRGSFAFFDPATGKLDVLAEPEPDKPGNRFNDGKCDRQGRLWAGTMGDVDWDSPVGSLYRFDANARPTRMEEGVCCSNGLGWSPDSKTMYFAESFRYRIHAYDFDAATGTSPIAACLPRSIPPAARSPTASRSTPKGSSGARSRFGRLVRYDPEGDRAHHRAAGLARDELHVRRRKSGRAVRDHDARHADRSAACRGGAGRQPLALRPGVSRDRRDTVRGLGCVNTWTGNA